MSICKNHCYFGFHNNNRNGYWLKAFSCAKFSLLQLLIKLDHKKKTLTGNFVFIQRQLPVWLKLCLMMHLEVTKNTRCCQFLWLASEWYDLCERNKIYHIIMKSIIYGNYGPLRVILGMIYTQTRSAQSNYFCPPPLLYQNTFDYQTVK